jgi:uncharacterized RDD family membrane protein YckC
MDKYNTTGARIGAAIVDSVIFWPFGLFNDYLTGILSSSTEYSAGLIIAWTIFAMSLFQCYSIFMHGKYGYTIGKKTMGVKIVSFPEELPITYKQAFIRDLPYTVLLLADIVINIAFILHPELIFNSTIVLLNGILGFAGLFWILVEIVSMLFNDKKRAVHDLIAKTVVIKTG